MNQLTHDATGALVLQLLTAIRAAPGATAGELARKIGAENRHPVAAALPEIEHASGLIERGLPRVCEVSRTRMLTWHPVWRQ